MSCPAAPSTPTVVHASPVPGYLAAPRWHPSSPTLEGGSSGTPLPQAGPAAGSRSLRERLVSLSASLSRAASPSYRVISSRGRRSVSQRRSGPGRAATSRFWSGASTLTLCSGLAPPSRPSSPSRHEHCSLPAAPHSNDVTTDTATPGRRRRSRSWGRRCCWAAGWSRCMWAAGSGRRSRSDDRRNPGLSCAAPGTGRRSENRDGGSGGAGHDTCPTTGKGHPDADSLATN